MTKKYRIGTSIICFDAKGRCAQFANLRDFSSWGASKSVKSHPSHSAEVTFNPRSVLHFLLQEIRKFNLSGKGTVTHFKGLYSNADTRQKEIFFNDLKQICKDAAKLVEGEERVLQLEDPIYVIGDIHGNLEDLLSLERTLWRSIPLLTINYLFLGDYVDRGRWSFECFLYLMVIKLLCPNKVFLLRGNHECRSLQSKYSFTGELITKYGKEAGRRIFDQYNGVMDRLPVCAVVSGAIYCAHGGLPYSIQDLKKLNKSTARVLPEPDNAESIWVWELLWSDPMDYSLFADTANVLGIEITEDPPSYKFLPNVKRGTSYLFNELATVDFFNLNNLQYMVRAHEVPPEGYRFNFDRLCTTIFSCSHYCGNDNEAAVLLISREARIRVIRIDTQDNKPAMLDH